MRTATHACACACAGRAKARKVEAQRAEALARARRAAGEGVEAGYDSDDTVSTAFTAYTACDTPLASSSTPV